MLHANYTLQLWYAPQHACQAPSWGSATTLLWHLACISGTASTAFSSTGSPEGFRLDICAQATIALTTRLQQGRRDVEPIRRRVQQHHLRGVQALEVYRQRVLDLCHHLPGHSHALDSGDGQGPVNVRLREPAARRPHRTQPSRQVEASTLI